MSERMGKGKLKREKQLYLLSTVLTPIMFNFCSVIASIFSHFIEIASTANKRLYISLTVTHKLICTSAKFTKLNQTDVESLGCLCILQKMTWTWVFEYLQSDQTRKALQTKWNGSKRIFADKDNHQMERKMFDSDKGSFWQSLYEI